MVSESRSRHPFKKKASKPNRLIKSRTHRKKPVPETHKVLFTYKLTSFFISLQPPPSSQMSLTCLPSWWTTSSSRPAPTSLSAVRASRGTRSSSSSNGDVRDNVETQQRRELRPPGSTLFSSSLKTKVSELDPPMQVVSKYLIHIHIQVLVTAAPKWDNI